MEKLIVTIPKNAREQIQVRVQEFQGHDLVAARVFYHNGDEDWKPGRNGLTVKVGLLPDLLVALTKAEIEVKKAGLLE